MSHKISPSLPDIVMDELYIAGQKVKPGRYRLVGSSRAIEISIEDTLPASLDGRVAVYVSETPTWADLKTKTAGQRGA